MSLSNVMLSAITETGIRMKRECHLTTLF